MNHWHKSPWLERCLFLLVLLFEAGIFIYLINTRSVVGGHDGFQYFALQYSFLNHAVHYGDIPQWFPFVTHGVLSTLGTVTHGGVMHNIFLLSGGLLKDVNFLPLFYAGIFIDELLLLIGVWLLAKRFFASPLTVFFVSVSVMGSCIWVLQPWWNFHLYYAIPLILYLMHRFLDSGMWRYYFLAGNLLFMQSMGNLPYFLPVTSMAIFLYFLFYVSLNFEDIWPKLTALRFGPAFVTATAFILLAFGILYYAMTFGIDQIANYNLRNPDGTTSLEGFLTYGGQFTWRAWLEMILGISPFLDYTLYIGMFCVPLIFLGIVTNTRKINLHFLLMVIVLLLFSMGTFVSVFFYYAWPMMKFFRHLMLVSPLIKVFLCFLAGFGLDAVLFHHSRPKNSKIFKVALALAALAMLALSIFLGVLANNYNISHDFILNLPPIGETLPLFTTILDENIIFPLLIRSTLFASLAFIAFAALCFTRRQKGLLVLAVLITALHCADIYGFKFSELKLKTKPLNDSLYQITNFQSMPYAPRRDVSFWDNNPRAELIKILPIQYGEFYWTTHAFLFKDQLENPFKTDLIPLPLDNYMKSYWDQSMHDLTNLHFNFWTSLFREFPNEHPAIFKISGVTQDKIQFFSAVDFMASDKDIAALICHPRYTGDAIFLSVPDNNREIATSSPSDHDLSANKRLNLSYEVLRFDANNIEISTQNDSPDPVWLFYSDVWHPLWRATVNEKRAPVYKANLAYKAVKLEPGANNVHFYFKSKFMSVLYLIFGLNALLWMMIILFITGIIVLNKRPIDLNPKHEPSSN